MMTPPLLLAARQLLALEAGEASAPEGAVRACEKISQRLVPLIGDAGVRSLFARSVKLAAVQFPWLGAVGVGSLDAFSAELRTALANQAPATAGEGAATLLANLVALLERFIGPGLTARLLHDVWAEVRPASPKEPT